VQTYAAGPYSFTLPAELIPGVTYYVIVAMRDYGVNFSQIDAQGYTTFVLPLPPAALSITKTVESDSVADNLDLLYTIQYYAVNTNNFMISDPVPAGVSFVKAYAGGTLSGGNVVWNLGSITSPVTGSVQWVAKVNTATLPGFVITNQAQASSDDFPSLPSNSVSSTTGIKFQTDKSASPNVVSALGAVTYTLSYTNTGYTFVDLETFDNAGPPGWTQVVGGGTWTVGGGIIKGFASATPTGLFPKLMKDTPILHDGIYVTDAYVPAGNVVGDAVLIFCSQDPNDEYHARFQADANQIDFDTVKAGVWANVAAVAPTGFTFAYNKWYTIKAQVRGNNIMIKVWPQGQPEPVTWDINYTDATPLTAKGKSGIQIDQIEDWFDNFKVFGPGPATNVRIYDTVPNCMTYVGCDSGCTYNPATRIVRWDFPGWLDDVQGLTVKFWVTADLCAGGTYVPNTDCMDSDENDPPACSGVATVYVIPATATITPTFTVTPTSTRTYTDTPTYTPTYTRTYTPTYTPSFTVTYTPTYTVTATDTQTATPTSTQTYTPTYTATYTSTPTDTPTFTPSDTPTFTRTFTKTATPTYTPTFTPTFTMTATPTYTRTVTPTITISPTAVLPIMELVKSAAPDPVQPGDTVTYTITYRNTGLLAATGFTITDQLDNYLQWVSGGTHSGGLTGGTVTLSAGNVPASSAWGSVFFTAIIGQDMPRGTIIPNTAHSTVNEYPGMDYPSNQHMLPVNVPSLQLTPVKNYPNPFQGATTIVFWVSVHCEVTIEFFTISGEKILKMDYPAVKANLVSSSDIKRGDNSVTWDGKNGYKRSVSSGVYFYKVTAKTSDESKYFISRLAVLR
jgi:uncharacterized repeat protein (TIGR01451 family)